MRADRKSRERKFRFLQSVSTKVILVIIILILPLNVLTIIYTNQARDTMISQAEDGIQKVADSYMQELGARMEISRSFLSYFLTEDADFIRMKLYRGETGDYEYASAKQKFYYKLRSMAEMTNGADGYFYFLPEKKDIVVWASADGAGKLASYLETAGTDERKTDLYLPGWRIAKYKGESYLILSAGEPEVQYGCALRLGTLLRNLKAAAPYENADVSLYCERPDAAAVKGRLTILSGTEDVWAQISVNISDILGNASVLQRILQVSSLFYLLLIPFLYVILYRLLIRPLSRLVGAHRKIDEGDLGYRIREQASSAEYEEVYQSFNQMAENIRTLKIENYERELDRNRMELQNLQLQIRPHFLLNTFNLIFTLAQRKEIETI